MPQPTHRPFARHLRVVSEIHREIATWLFENAEAPLNTDVTVTRVELSKDLSLATAYFLAHEGQDNDAIAEQLSEYVHAIQRELGANLRLKRTPKVRFVYDRQYAHSAAMEKILMSLPETDRQPLPTDQETHE